MIGKFTHVRLATQNKTPTTHSTLRSRVTPIDCMFLSISIPLSFRIALRLPPPKRPELAAHLSDVMQCAWRARTLAHALLVDTRLCADLEMSSSSSSTMFQRQACARGPPTLSNPTCECCYYTTENAIAIVSTPTPC